MEPRQEDQARVEGGVAGMSADIAAANTGTTPVREGFAFDEASLARWLEANVAGYAGPLVIEQFKGGQSNLT